MNRQTVSILGIPYDAGSTYLRGAALAPPLIREALFSEASNLWTEDGLDLGKAGTLADAGDLRLPAEAESAFALIENSVREILSRGHPLICLGGDHSITYPILRGFHSRYSDVTILHFDAHSDSYIDYGGRLSHACPFTRIMENGLARRLIQIGIRTINEHQLPQVEKYGIEVFAMRDLARLADLTLDGPLYISLDVDVLDPAAAPGVSHYEPGGMSSRDVLNIIQGISEPVIGADIVEFNPARDFHSQTAAVCAKFLKEIASAMLRL